MRVSHFFVACLSIFLVEFRVTRTLRAERKTMNNRFSKLVAALAFAAMLAFGTNSYAATAVNFNGVGATVLYNTLALAAVSTSACGTNIWTYKKGASAIDSRSASIPEETGNIWIVWNTNAAGTAVTSICSFLALDATVGAQLYFAVPRSTLSIPSTEIGLAGQSLVPTLTDTTLTQIAYNAINTQAFNAGILDSRPEDALFSETRALAALTTNYSGLGYGPGPIGIPIQSAFSTAESTPVSFAIAGTDPITGEAVPAWIATDLGAAPEIIFVNTGNTGSTGDFSNVAAFQNVNRFDLALALNGTLPYTRDLSPTLGLPEVPLNVILRDPLSGAFNVLEYCISRNVEINSTQEVGVNPAAAGGNPLDLTNAGGGWRKRALSSSEMVTEVGTTANGNVLGYTFWSTGNFSSVVGTTRYLTVDGVDPLYPSYAGGSFPTCTAPCPGLVTFTNILNGSYPIWTTYRVVTAAKVPAGVTALIAAAQTQAANTVPDFVPLSQMTVFRSHYSLSGRIPSNGYGTTKESGGDLGGAVFPIQADLDYLADTGLELTGYKQ
jgi:hypothetical protein